MCKFSFLRFVLLVPFICTWCFVEPYDIAVKWPTIGIAVLVRNKAHTLPYFLTCLHDLDYPKDRIYLWFHSDFNEDKSDEILTKWVERYESDYNGVQLTTNSSSIGQLQPDQEHPHHWSPQHFEHVINLREQALDFIRKLWADYIFMVDADVFLTNKDTLKDLVKKQLPVVAPMLISDGIYSNFWCAMNEYYYYKRTDDYMPILQREQRGCFPVPMVHTAVLADLRRRASDALGYRPPRHAPLDDIIAFALHAQKHDIPLHICNEQLYGFAPVPLEATDDPSSDLEQLVNVKLEAISRHYPLPLDPLLAHYVTYPKPWKYGMSEIYMINLDRRRERREMMEQSFKELGMSVKLFKAIDGRQLDMSDLRSPSITLMQGYEDPYHRRPMKAGEVGCFLSHYFIWKEMVANQSEVALVLEDDIHFVPFFRLRFLTLMNEIKDMDWDLVYIGRKILSDADEPYVSEHTTAPYYSYWTLGYVLRLSGAEKLLAARPLDRLLPVDEFLPIMFDKHPNATWKANFPNRNLKALSAAPLLVHPTHYTGQEGYISDTEDSAVVAPGTPGENVRNEL
ncbi:hypothetical protein ABMA28_000019 [Loxostege sticticalis]|uniref:Glycosyl transferase family 25 domain-containing protein n=1 Tax=Loxostege sticticalis TaxID=481309 RepID=A0ABD0TQS2_LOXSC